MVERSSSSDVARSSQRCPLPSAAPAPRRDGTGTMVWECGIVLAKYLELHADALLRHGRASPPRVLELGAGVGTAGLAAAALGNA